MIEAWLLAPWDSLIRAAVCAIGTRRHGTRRARRLLCLPQRMLAIGLARDAQGRKDFRT